MTEQNDRGRFCLEFADFPNGGQPGLIEKAEAIEEAMTERLPGVFTWHSVVASPEIGGVKVFFNVDPDGEGINETVPETLIGIIREIGGRGLPGNDPVAA
ncbi:MAG: hypothetical protein M9938_10895 [Solirubrobacterales bacterium]|nr:hypothetical protein [Solirubrobacterales bacterium]